MNDTLTHELVHTLDYCRAELDWNNIHHLACTEIRAASLSGECFFWKENFARLKFGWKKHHQVWQKGSGKGSICLSYSQAAPNSTAVVALDILLYVGDM